MKIRPISVIRVPIRVFEGRLLCILTMLFLVCTFSRVTAQHLEQIKSALKEQGFENLRVVQRDSNLYVSLENKVFRWDVAGIRKALDIICEEAGTAVRAHLILLDKGIPVLSVSVGCADWQEFRKGNIPAGIIASSLQVTELPGEEWLAVKDKKPVNRPFGKTDLIVIPQFYFENTLKTRLYTSQFNIAPALQVALLRGMQMTGQVIIPLYNELGYEGDFIRPGQVVLSQEFRYRRLTGKAAAGNFSSSRYGADLSLRYLLPSPNWSLKANAGLTGSSHFLNKELKLGSLKSVTGSLSATWFIPRFNVEMEGGLRRYIYGDTGIFGLFTRWFGETAVGFWAMTSTLGGDAKLNGGFHFTVPFPFKKRPRNHFFRITLPEYQGFVYNGGTEFYYGQQYTAGPGSNMVEGFLRAEFYRDLLVK